MLILRYIFTGGLSFRATHQFGPCTFLCNRLTGLINNLLMISICRASALMQGNNTCYFLEEMWDIHFPHWLCSHTIGGRRTQSIIFRNHKFTLSGGTCGALVCCVCQDFHLPLTVLTWLSG